MTREPGPSPVVVLCVLAAIPTILLAAVASWFGGRAEGEPTPVAVVDSPSPVVVPASAVMSLRRQAAVLSRRANQGVLAQNLSGLVDRLPGDSCLSVSVDGVPVLSAGVPSVIPASNQKVLIASAALSVLGDDHTFVTEVLGPDPADGIIEGDLVLVGGGDPLLSSDWYPESSLDRFPVFNATSLDSLADAIVARGVRSVSGAVIGDGSRYDDEWYASDWADGIAGIEAGPIDALLVNDARVLGDDYRGSDPGQAAAREFQRLLVERGVTFGEEARSGVASGGSSLATISSMTLPAVLREMLVNSDNNTAEMVLKEIGLEASGSGSRAAGVAAVAAHAVALGGTATPVDGSGLAASNRLSCQLLVNAIDRDRDFFEESLPVAGSTGALADAFLGSPVEGRLFAKTGTLGNPPYDRDPPAVKALAGVVASPTGERLTFALVLNAPTVNDQREYRPLWDLLATALGAHPTGPGVSLLGPE